MKPSKIIEDKTAELLKKVGLAGIDQETLMADPIKFCMLISCQIQGMLDFLDEKAPKEDLWGGCEKCPNCQHPYEFGIPDVCVQCGFKKEMNHICEFKETENCIHCGKSTV